MGNIKSKSNFSLHEPNSSYKIPFRQS